MLKTHGHFTLALGSVMVSLGLALALALAMGDSLGQPLIVSFAYLPEGAGGLPQIALTFPGVRQPERDAAEGAFGLQPAVSGDFSWNGTLLLFTPATRLRADSVYTVTLRGGVRLTGGGRSNYTQTPWTFRTRPARIAFLKREGQAVNLWLISTDGSVARPLTTETTRRVVDFSVSPGGERIVYSLQAADYHAISLWLVRTTPPSAPIRLVDEPNVGASAPRWSPGGDVIAYQRRVIFNTTGFSDDQLWLIKPDGTSLAPLWGGTAKVGVNVRWAAGGTRAFFWEPKRGALAAFSFAKEPAWYPLQGQKLEDYSPSPDGREVMLARYDYSGRISTQNLRHMTVQTSPDGQVWQLSPTQPPVLPTFDDHAPAWSPDGTSIAFLRQGNVLNPDRSSQVWLLDAQSGVERPLLVHDDPTAPANQGAFDWSSDSQRLVFERYPVGQRNTIPKSAVWAATGDGLHTWQVASDGFAPQWVL